MVGRPQLGAAARAEPEAVREAAGLPALRRLAVVLGGVAVAASVALDLVERGVRLCLSLPGLVIEVIEGHRLVVHRVGRGRKAGYAEIGAEQVEARPARARPRSLRRNLPCLLGQLLVLRTENPEHLREIPRHRHHAPVLLKGARRSDAPRVERREGQGGARRGADRDCLRLGGQAARRYLDHHALRHCVGRAPERHARLERRGRSEERYEEIAGRLLKYAVASPVVLEVVGAEGHRSAIVRRLHRNLDCFQATAVGRGQYLGHRLERGGAHRSTTCMSTSGESILNEGISSGASVTFSPVPSSTVWRNSAPPRFTCPKIEGQRRRWRFCTSVTPGAPRIRTTMSEWRTSRPSVSAATCSRTTATM